MEALYSLLGGLLLLIIGGELLVRGAVQVAERLGVSQLLIGLTLVGFGTSVPEMVISVHASLSGAPGIALGNIVGSSIANILFILGAAAFIYPIAVSSRALGRDGVVVLVTSVLFMIVGFASLQVVPFGPFIGWSFLAMLFAYLVYAFQQERVVQLGEHMSAFQRARAYSELRSGGRRSWLTQGLREGALVLAPLALAVVGLIGIMLGGTYLVEGAVAIAKMYGVSETVIGLTIVAIGTSMPEFVTCVVAALRGHASVALGNVLGSNIYNILGVGGVTAVLAPTVVPNQIIYFDNLVLVGAAVLLMVFARSGFRISRLEGAFMLACYVTYIYWLLPPGLSAGVSG